MLPAVFQDGREGPGKSMAAIAPVREVGPEPVGGNRLAIDAVDENVHAGRRARENRIPRPAADRRAIGGLQLALEGATAGRTAEGRRQDRSRFGPVVQVPASELYVHHLRI